jgi:hypothetical protein
MNARIPKIVLPDGKIETLIGKKVVTQDGREGIIELDPTATREYPITVMFSAYSYATYTADGYYWIDSDSEYITLVETENAQPVSQSADQLARLLLESCGNDLAATIKVIMRQHSQ